MSTTPRPSSRRPRRSLAAVAAASALLLSGCGAGGWNPGVGISAGDETISRAHVDEVTAAFCDAIGEELKTSGQALTGRYLRRGVAGELAAAAVARQVVDDHGLEVTGQYDRQVSSLEESFADLPEEQRDALLEVRLAGIYVVEAKVAVGEALLVEEGASEPTREESIARGDEAFADWAAENDVRVDPSFGIAVEDGVPVPADTSLSFAVSDTAERGGADEPDPTYTGTLPSSQRCG